MEQTTSELLDEIIALVKNQTDPNHGPLLTVSSMIQNNRMNSSKYNRVNIIYGGYELKIITHNISSNDRIYLEKLTSVQHSTKPGQMGADYSYYSVALYTSDIPKLKELLYCMEDYMGHAFVPEVWELVDKFI